MPDIPTECIVHYTDQHGDMHSEEGEHNEEEHKKSSSKKVIQ